MPLNLYNTLTTRAEPVFAADGKTIRMYVCGPTVYDYGHIGNFRTFVHVDILRRWLFVEGFHLNHVMNITDVDDKIIRNATAAGESLADYTRKYEQAFLEDMDTLRIQRPEHIVRATEHIPQMTEMISQLAAKNAAYQSDDGSWYFRIASFPDYGKLSKKDLAGMTDGARVDVDEYDKDSARDFALWKARKPGEAHWETAIGDGRPGWHIECSAMARQYLGDSFDLHAGGEDLMFPHHENEIAQSESATGKPFARHWMHVRFLLVDGRKMSKSEGNYYTLRDLLIAGYKSSAIRFLLASVPYRNQFNFTLAGLTEAATAVERLRAFAARVESTTPATNSVLNPVLADEITRASHHFTAAMNDDLNTAGALGAVFDLVRAGNTALDAGAVTIANRDAILAFLARFDAVFDILTDRDLAATRAAIAWADAEHREVPAEVRAALSLSDAEINQLIADRNAARARRDFKAADAIRDSLLVKGILLEDGKDGVRWRRR